MFFWSFLAIFAILIPKLPFTAQFDFDVDYPLRPTTITRARRRRISQQIADWGSSGPIFAERPRTKYPFLEPLPDRKPGFRAIQLTDTPINGPNGSRLTAK